MGHRARQLTPAEGQPFPGYHLSQARDAEERYFDDSDEDEPKGGAKGGAAATAMEEDPDEDLDQDRHLDRDLGTRGS